jgi:hypothetical protein
LEIHDLFLHRSPQKATFSRVVIVEVDSVVSLLLDAGYAPAGQVSFVSFVSTACVAGGFSRPTRPA